MKKKGFWEKLLKHTDEDDDSFQHLNSIEKDMIKGVVELSETTVKEVMVPRIDVVFVSVDTSLTEVIQILIECGHSRVPVYKETIDNVCGVLYAKDLLKIFVSTDTDLEKISLENLIRKPFFVPESKKLDSLLIEFKRKKVHIAVSVDEYGGVSGIVCMEDIIEEIVGEIQDEFDNEDEEIIKIGDGIYLCDARINIEDLNQEIQVDIPAEEFETLGGWVFALFGKIPVKYEKVSIENMDFIIQEVDGHKINKIKIIKKAKQ
ncbi:MAG: hemolysin family protein [Spirochaetales bacterium]|uniref:Hemolysin family protein n=1 Tax=Candidatus Thalassospirochaeta sargassi TaxID=3119039 RepID=A0AAJ1IHH7_9SPIO|nr:hemolysin family protein [Spirochaetales bacterium]